MWEGALPQFWVDLVGILPWQYVECFDDDSSAADDVCH
jgi:hypothetical protein